MEIKKVRYPIGVQSFEDLRKEGYVYVDKTGYIPLLLDNKYYFLSRPRRFGKSLFLSTLEAYFQGKKDLFEGLEISKYEKEWKCHPVVHIDFAAMKTNNPEELSARLELQLESIATKYDVTIPPERRSPDLAFNFLTERLYEVTGEKVVILIDEYDKGILEVLNDEDLKRRATDVLRPFFSVLKTQDRHIRFAFITGVSRFRNTTIFSGFNNPYDLSMDPDYAAICGITKQELATYFNEGIKKISDIFDYTREKTIETLLQKYDGYRFTFGKEYVCNPFSIINAFKSGHLGDYWIMSGTSKILVDYLCESNFSLEELTTRWVPEAELSSTYSRADPLSLFFQTGYLTIADYENGYYRLAIPNEEVQSSLADLLIPEFVNRSGKEVRSDQFLLRQAITNGDVDGMMSTLKRLVSSVPYHEIEDKTQEKHIHLCMCIIFMMLGTNTRCEIATCAGRVDMMAQTPWRVYVFEFKLDGTAKEALRQIDEKGYAIQWEAKDRIVTKIGVNYSTKLRTIDDWEYR